MAPAAWGETTHAEHIPYDLDDMVGDAGGLHAQKIILEVGMGRLLQLPGPAASIFAADPQIARVQPASSTSVYVMAVANGSTTVVAVDARGKPIAEYSVLVRSSLDRAKGNFEPAALEAAIRMAVPSAQKVRVGSLPNGVVLDGPVASPDEAQQIMAVARAMVGDQAIVINSLDVLSNIQVNVRVRIVEVSRQITRELGFSWQSLYGTGKFALGLATGGALGTASSASGQVLGMLNGRVASTLAGAPARLGGSFKSSRFDINGVIDALAADQLVTVLAEPNLTALSGETASFLAGGEFPIPIAATDSNQITVEFKQFGVSLSFVPTVLSPDHLNIKIRPEVSELTDAGSVSIPIAGGALRIPALAVRRAETTVELGSGQSFAIAGLLQNSSSQLVNAVPGLSSLPILGNLFKSKSFRRNETELVIIVTPYLVQPASSPNDLATPLRPFVPATDIGRLLSRAIEHDSSRIVPAFDAGFIVE